MYQVLAAIFSKDFSSITLAIPGHLVIAWSTKRVSHICAKPNALFSILSAPILLPIPVFRLRPRQFALTAIPILRPSRASDYSVWAFSRGLGPLDKVYPIFK